MMKMNNPTMNSMASSLMNLHDHFLNAGISNNDSNNDEDNRSSFETARMDGKIDYDDCVRHVHKVSALDANTGMLPLSSPVDMHQNKMKSLERTSSTTTVVPHKKRTMMQKHSYDVDKQKKYQRSETQHHEQTIGNDSAKIEGQPELPQRRENVRRFLLKRLRSSKALLGRQATDATLSTTNVRNKQQLEHETQQQECSSNLNTNNNHNNTEELIKALEHLLFRNQLYQNNDDIMLIESIDDDTNTEQSVRQEQEAMLRSHLKHIMCNIFHRKLIQQQPQQLKK